MIKRYKLNKFKKEWVKNEKGKKYPYPLFDGEYNTSYYFSLIIEFEVALQNKLTITLGISLMSAIEQAGRYVLRNKKVSENIITNKLCFNEFLEKYMNYKKIKANRYDIFRNGMIHHGLPKTDNTCGIGPESHPYILKKMGIKKVNGLHIHRDGYCDITLSILLKEFETGVRKLRWHEIKYNWN